MAVESCAVLTKLEPKSQEYENEDFITGLGGNIYSNGQIEQHQVAERVHHSREAPAILGSYSANEAGDKGVNGIWRFGLGMSWKHERRRELSCIYSVQLSSQLIHGS